MLWYLSFADPQLPRGHQFLGVSVIEACSAVSAYEKSVLLKLNPGGEVKMASIPFENETEFEPYKDQFIRAELVVQKWGKARRGS